MLLGVKEGKFGVTKTDDHIRYFRRLPGNSSRFDTTCRLDHILLLYTYWNTTLTFDNSDDVEKV
jgi:hypothetical protein